MIGVTGGAGFIGTEFVKLLRAEGHDTRIIDIKKSSSFPDISSVSDICVMEQLLEGLRGCTEIYHLAAEHRDDVTPTERYYQVNGTGTANLVDVAEVQDVDTIVFTSTVAVYGLGQEASSESSEAAPFNDYGRSKLQAEEILKLWAQRKPGRRLVIVRLAATFGPGSRGNLHRMIEAIHRGRFVVVGSGRNRKSIAYVKNVAAFLGMCRSLPAGTTVVNYADKPDLTTADLVRTVRRALGRAGTGPRVPLAIGLAGGAALGLVRAGDPRAVPVILGRIRKFSANTVVQTARLDATRFTPPFSLPQALHDTVVAEFGARSMIGDGRPAKKIVYVINHLDWFWSHRLPLARKIRQLGWDVIVAAPHAAGAVGLDAHGFTGAEMPVSSRRRPLATLLRALWQIKCLLERERPAIVHAITLKSAISAALAARWFGDGVAVVVTIAGLGYLFCSASRKARLARLVLTPFLRHAFDRQNVWVIFQNTSDRDALARRQAIRPDRSVVIRGSGVDLAEFPYRAEPDAPWPIVLMASRLVREKGVAVFAETASLLKVQGHRARFVLAGGLDETNPAALSAEEMEALTATFPIEWLGHVANLVDLYARSAIFVYPSYYGEGVPKVLLEAAAVGRPIVTTDHPGCRDVVSDGVNGFLVPARDAPATAGAIAQLLADPQLRAAMGRRSRERAVREFDVGMVVRDTVALYARALAGSAPRLVGGQGDMTGGPPAAGSSASDLVPEPVTAGP